MPTINPTLFADAETASMLQALLASDLNRQLWLTNKEYVLNGNSYRLTHTILLNEKTNEQRSYVIMSGDPLKAGAFGQIFSIDGCFLVTDQSIRSEERFSYPRVVKIQVHHEYQHPVSAVKSEYQNMKRTSHLMVEMPIVVTLTATGDPLTPGSKKLGNKCLSFMIMKRMPGCDLYEWLDNQLENRIPHWSYSEQLELSDCFLHTLRREVDALGLIHRDITPENIMLQIDSSNDNAFESHVIDYGLACDKSIVRMSPKGKPVYVAPETLNGMVNPKVDVYSMGQVFQWMWGECPSRPAERDIFLTNKWEEIKKSTQLNVTFEFVIALFNIIKQMVEKDVSARLSLDVAIIQMDALCNEWRSFQVVAQRPASASPHSFWFSNENSGSDVLTADTNGYKK